MVPRIIKRWPLVLCWIVCMQTMTSSVYVDSEISSDVHDFEDANDNWTTLKDYQLVRVQAKMNEVNGAPSIDATLGTGQGHYGYAMYNATNHHHVLFSACQPPSGAQCRLNFSAVINTKHSLRVGSTLSCDACLNSKGNESWKVVEVAPTEPEKGWQHISVELGTHEIPYDVTIFVAVKEPKEFIAIDDLQFIDCEQVPSLPLSCPSKKDYQCDVTRKCLSRDRLCDLVSDCVCGGDEAEELCEIVPFEGRFTLQDCDFDSSNCLWYNVRAGHEANSWTHPTGHDEEHKGAFRWRSSRVTSGKSNRLVQMSTPPGFQTTGSIKKSRGSDSHYTGPYVYVTMPPKNAGSVAVLRSVSLQPRFSSGGLCQVRFHYRITALSASLRLDMVAVGKPGRSQVHKVKWEQVVNTNNDVMDPWTWKRVVVDLNTEAINSSYILQFRAITSDPKASGQVAVHSISLSPECFIPDLKLSTCGMSGHIGPTQRRCDGSYGQNGKVNVVRGIQSWVVPETAIYTIQALGSRGGKGFNASDSVLLSRGSRVTAKFWLLKEEELFFVVGQVGEDATCQLTGMLLPAYCFMEGFDPAQNAGGSGGGGGATIVFKRKNGTKPEVLMVAGGGGGLPSHLTNDLKASLARNYFGETTVATVTSAISESSLTEKEAGSILSRPLEGKAPCHDKNNPSAKWESRGGFGAGGGACGGGGRGGPLLGGEEERFTRSTSVGEPGKSYVHKSALYSFMETGIHAGPGFIEISPVRECPCDYHCIWLGARLTNYTCLCPTGMVLQRDGISCAVAQKVMQEEESNLYLGIIAGALFLVFVSIICICLYIQRQSATGRRSGGIKKAVSLVCPCLHLSRRPLSANVLPQRQRPPTVMQVNPNYDLVGTKCPEQGLKDLPRKHLKCICELGKGAFGEVYYGLLSNVPMVDGDLPVAVKTLQPVCTEQTEMDFLMEAVIVSKFNHPNIVRFIGVCFEQHPHYLVLELLEGGDLKSFLRNARPKWDQPSQLTVRDLLRLSLDVARGCQHLEEKHFIHRDLAARNCLLTTKGPNRTAKIADFGMARDIYRNDYYKKAGKAMLPVKWMPPEAFLDGVFTSKTDIWSFGILLWEVFSLGHIPYPGNTNEGVMSLVTQGGRLDPPEGCPSAVFDIMASCWSALPEGRPTFSLIISSLEKTLQDDDMSQRGLPVFYVPPIINSRGLRLHERQPSTPPTATTRAVSNHAHPVSSPNSSGDGYLVPLLRHNYSGKSSDGQVSFSNNGSPRQRGAELDRGGAVGENRANRSHRLLKDIHEPQDDSSDFGDKNRPITKQQFRAPKVFYKPGISPHVTIPDASSEALLPPDRYTDGDALGALPNGAKIKFADDDDVEDDDSDDNDFNTEDGENLKMGVAVALPERSKKKKSYTKFPRPGT
ncbi:ALK tyrosine kinase receptor [Aplysia californica]|uniref:receptor protein-tyrosine kinase n=1 Tax=Aplysia californica TaxID=6500 RepID=A0ABM1VTG6_APLCA|nr:ALK tyrosine kinase receptor [Aplysia californica]